MRNILHSLSIFLLLSAGLLGSTLTGKVIKVTDGDTITFLSNKVEQKIRLSGLDAPERSQAYGSKSTQALEEILLGKNVRVQTSTKDRYGRLIGTLFADGENINEWMVRQGWAWHYTKYSSDQRLAVLEKEAKAHNRGLWADYSTPIAPWLYRNLAKQSRAIKKGDAQPLGYWLNTSSGTRHNSSCRHYKSKRHIFGLLDGF